MNDTGLDLHPNGTIWTLDEEADDWRQPIHRGIRYRFESPDGDVVEGTPGRVQGYGTGTVRLTSGVVLTFEGWKITRLSDCVFCQVVTGVPMEHRPYVWRQTKDVIVFKPLNPVVEGPRGDTWHWLVVPKHHVSDAAVDPAVTALVMDEAARVADNMAGTDDVNIITSVGPAATQTVPHLHVHVVGRAEGDGLHLPWTSQAVPGERGTDGPALRGQPGPEPEEVHGTPRHREQAGECTRCGERWPCATAVTSGP